MCSDIKAKNEQSLEYDTKFPKASTLFITRYNVKFNVNCKTS